MPICWKFFTWSEFSDESITNFCYARMALTFFYNMGSEDIVNVGKVPKVIASSKVTNFFFLLIRFFRFKLSLWITRDSSIHWPCRQFILFLAPAIQIWPFLIRYLWSKIFFHVIDDDLVFGTCRKFCINKILSFSYPNPGIIWKVLTRLSELHLLDIN